MSAGAAPAIRTRGLGKTWGRTVGIRDLDLVVREGEIFGFLGPNGAGKTTTIRLLLGLVRPTRGTAWLLGRPLRDALPGLLADVGYLPGDFGLYGDMTGYAYLEHLLRLRSRGRPDRRTLEDLEARFPVDLGRPIRTYSKGMRQIVGILQAFAHGPRLLVLDEPSAGLDPLMQERLHDLLREQRDRGRTVFFSSHVLREVEQVCDRVGIVRDGRLLVVQDVGDYRAQLGKRVRITTGGAPGALAAALEALRGTRNLRELRERKDGVELYWSGPLPELLRRVAPLEIDDFLCEDPDVEDLFLEHYRDRSRGPAGAA